MLLTNSHQALILHNPAEPCAECPFAAILFQPLKCFPACILNFFFGIVVISEHEARSPQARAVMLLNQAVERCPISKQGKFEQFFVIRGPFSVYRLIGGLVSVSRMLSTDFFVRCSFLLRVW